VGSEMCIRDRGFLRISFRDALGFAFLWGFIQGFCRVSCRV
jgi:hypothetical protein